MPTLSWTDELALQHPQMDQTHREFVELLSAVETSLDAGSDADALATFDRLLTHTIEHFAQEDRWMNATGFASDNCHSHQHQTVLAVLREVARQARDEGKLEPMRLAVPELGIWFKAHAQMMDAALAWHLQQTGFDAVTGTVAKPLGDSGSISGCGSASCS